jgi:hypothetical protein
VSGGRKVVGESKGKLEDMRPFGDILEGLESPERLPLRE